MSEQQPRERGFATPEEAAREEIPERYARLLGVSVAPWGEHAVVLLGTNEEPFLYPYQVSCYREEVLWYSGSGGNGPSAPLGIDEGVRLVTLWEHDPLPPDVKAAVVGDRGEEHVVPVVDGYYLYAAWEHDVSEEESNRDIPQPMVVRLIREAGG